MPTYKLPTAEKKWIQGNKSDVLGNLFGTFNIDFDSNLGRARVSDDSRIIADSTDDADLGLPWAFVRTSADGTDRWWAGCGSVLFKSTDSSPAGTYSQDALGSSPTTLSASYSDIVEFNGALLAVGLTDMWRLSTTWTANWWTSTLGQAALTTGVPHPLHVTKKTNQLLIGDDNKVHVVSTSNNVRNGRLVFPAEFEVQWIRSSSEGSWIGIRNTQSGEAEAAFWDESSENYNRSYKLRHDRTLAGAVKGTVPYTVNGAGQLLAFNGSDFQEVGVFPNFDKTGKQFLNTVGYGVHRNGMDISEDAVHILVSSRLSALADTMENFPSGIWTFSENQGLRHKYSLSIYDGTEIDYGTFLTDLPGALKAVGAIASNVLFLAGAWSFSNATTSLTAIFRVGGSITLNRRGHFITSIMEAGAFEDVFQDILLQFRRFLNSGDRIIVKYRTVKAGNYPIFISSLTWSDTDTFTTTTDLTNASAGDEVLILRGRGSGALVHISSLSEAGGTWTVNIDETIPNVSGTSVAMINDWIKAGTISTQSIERQSFDIDAVGTFIQFKIELRSSPGGSATGDSPELESLTVRSKPEYEI